MTLPGTPAGGEARYLELREQWDPALRTLAKEMVYPWAQIDRAIDPASGRR